jgi:putative CocE/NonD family hydrolase
MTAGSRILATLARLPRAATRDVAVERDLAAKMPDGVELLADRWYPASGPPAPIVLLRSPYGRRQVGVVGRVIAERGYQAIIQSCRGTFGSGGDWEPFRHEAEDGRATLEWLAGQAWFSGTVGTMGPSYLGLTQWAVASDPPEFLRAMAPAVTATDFRDAVVYPFGVFALECTLSWAYQVEHQERPWREVFRSMRRSHRVLTSAFRTLPVGECDTAALGHHVPFLQEWLSHDHPGDPYWDPIDFGRTLDRVPPVSLVGGWYDIFLPWQIADFQAVRAAGGEARLTVGPWSHTSPGGLAAMLRDSLDWFGTHLDDGRRPRRRRRAVRLFVMGSRRWVDLDAWPPPADKQRWHLDGGGRLSPDAPSRPVPDRYHYEPANPTPAQGGPLFDWRTAGPRDQGAREGRADVLTYTSEPISEDMTVAGPLWAELFVRSSLPHTDFCACLCDVSPRGKSINLSIGIIRLAPDASGGDITRQPDGVVRVRVPMWPTAHTFRRGHRVRVQVSSGAFPHFARNPGTGEPTATAARLLTSDNEVLHDPQHPSGIDLPLSPI